MPSIYLAENVPRLSFGEGFQDVFLSWDFEIGCWVSFISNTLMKYN